MAGLSEALNAYRDNPSWSGRHVEDLTPQLEVPRKHLSEAIQQARMSIAAEGPGMWVADPAALMMQANMPPTLQEQPPMPLQELPQQEAINPAEEFPAVQPVEPNVRRSDVLYTAEQEGGFDFQAANTHDYRRYPNPVRQSRNDAGELLVDEGGNRVWDDWTVLDTETRRAGRAVNLLDEAGQPTLDTEGANVTEQRFFPYWDRKPGRNNPDRRGTLTIGYGHTGFDADDYPDGITVTQAQDLLEADRAATAWNAARGTATEWADLPQWQRGLMTDIEYNTGNLAEYESLMAGLRLGTPEGYRTAFMEAGTNAGEEPLTNRNIARRNHWFGGEPDLIDTLDPPHNMRWRTDWPNLLRPNIVGEYTPETLGSSLSARRGWAGPQLRQQ